ncbi:MULTISPECIES: MFS transporter [unclassified Legionella]|uniref:MFS transporter n=1 Tax=unclassified Legionella TaxID=2622702 RepID=UPI0010559639|nr:MULTISPECIES: MFS transporter [unclassified Legionella]MDI9818599.1 MFS transporter [Legionella sp. PL877]
MFRLKNSHLPFLMWLLPLLFFTYQFILRLWPGLMMEQFSIGASQFGVLAALYYYGYSGMQIPIAVMLERFNARYIVFIFAVLCGLASLLFSYTNNWYLACLSRLLIGVGSAAGFLTVSKVISEWFPQNQYSKMIGFSFTLGLLGAIYGGKPISLLVTHYDWQTVALTLSLIAIMLGAAAYSFLRSPKSETQTTENVEQFKLTYFKSLLSMPTIWLLAFANFLMVGSLEGFADVWGVPYLMTAFSIEKTNAAELISFIFVGMLFGGPLLAFLSKKFGNYWVLGFCGSGMAMVFLFLLSSHQYNWYLLAALFLTIGILCCYQVIVFAAGADLVHSKLRGVTIAFLNCINMLGGSFFHTKIGHAMDASWMGNFNSEGVRLYTLESFKASLGIIPHCALLGSLMMGLIGLSLYYRRDIYHLQKL